VSGEGQGGRDDWTPGDLALCINGEGWFVLVGGEVAEGAHPTAGQILTVTQIGVHALGIIGLKFQSFGQEWYEAAEFRKITPGADIQGVEAEKRHPIPSLMPVPE
jgi:hypothetical protein